MGRSKQMLDVKGEKLLVKTIQTVLRAGLSPVIIVLGSDVDGHRKLIRDLPVTIVHNPHWQSGMGSTIKAGLQQLTSKHPSPEAVVIAVCDQPLLSAETISNLISQHEQTGKPVIASGYSGAPGVPVLFHRTYFEKLQNLPDDTGAKKIILQNLADVSVVPFPGGEIDLDTPEDYNAFVGSA